MASALSRIRDNMGLVVVVVAISLASFVLIDLFKNRGGSQEDGIAEVYGEPVPGAASEQMEKYLERNQTEDPLQESWERSASLRERAFQSAVNNAILGKEYDAIGLTVQNEDLINMYYGFRGGNPHQFVMNAYMFRDSTGNVSIGAIQNALTLADELNPGHQFWNQGGEKFKQDMIDIDFALSQTRADDKLSALYRSAAFVADNEVNWSYKLDNRSADIDYLFVPYSTIPDEQITVTDDDLRKYYDAHKNEYKGLQEAVVEYAYFPITPSPEDTAETLNRLATLQKGLLTAENPGDFAFTNTDAPLYDSNFVVLDSVPSYLQGLAKAARTDTVLGPFLRDGNYVISKIGQVRKDSLPLRLVSHIVVTVKDTADSAAARTRAAEIAARITPETFADSAKVLSDDKNSAPKGGRLGYFQGPLNPTFAQFQEDLEKANPGDIFITESPQGIHVVYLEKQTDSLYQVAEIERRINPSSKTRKLLRKEVNKFVAAARKANSLEEARKQFPNAILRPAQPVSPSDYSLLGLKTAGRKVVAWAFNQEGENKVGERIIEGEATLVLPRLVRKYDKGVRPFESVKEEVRADVIRQKKAEMIKGKLTGPDMKTMLSGYGPGAQKGSITSLSYRVTRVTEFGGDEPKVVGAVFGIGEGNMSKPIAGNLGVYVVKTVKLVEPPQESAEFMVQIQRQQLQMQKAQAIPSLSRQALLDLSNMKDLRYLRER